MPRKRVLASGWAWAFEKDGALGRADHRFSPTDRFAAFWLIVLNHDVDECAQAFLIQFLVEIRYSR